MKWGGMLSRKFIGLILATVLVWFAKIDDQVWLWVMVAYIGGNVANKFIDNYKGKL
jgi:hypothetical protein